MWDYINLIPEEKLKCTASVKYLNSTEQVGENMLGMPDSHSARTAWNYNLWGHHAVGRPRTGGRSKFNEVRMVQSGPRPEFNPRKSPQNEFLNCHKFFTTAFMKPKVPNGSKIQLSYHRNELYATWVHFYCTHIYIQRRQSKVIRI